MREIDIICAFSDHDQSKYQIKFKIFTTQFVSTTSETTEQNLMELGSYYGHNMQTSLLSLSHFIHIWYLDWP
jgi:hypothetical protein